jgi:septum formation inhibitor MinC
MSGKPFWSPRGAHQGSSHTPTFAPSRSIIKTTFPRTRHSSALRFTMRQSTSSTQSPDLGVDRDVDGNLKELDTTCTICCEAAVEPTPDMTSISSAEVETAAQAAAVPQPQPPEDETFPSDRDEVKVCAASKASNGRDDSQEIEPDLRKMTQPGIVVDAIECEGEVSGWIHVSLTTAAMEAVQAHPGIEAIKVEESMVHCSASSKGKNSNVEECTTGTTVTEKTSCVDDISAAGVSHVRRSRPNNGMYTVYPKASSDTKTTEEFLRSKVQSGTHIYHFSNRDGIITAWWGLHIDLDAKVAIQNHEGVWDVEDGIYSDDNLPSCTKKSNANDAVGDTEPLESVHLVQPNDTTQTHANVPRRQLKRRDKGVYTVFPKQFSDTEATEEFIKSKVRSGTQVYNSSNDIGIIAWWGLHLDAEAKAAVQNHVGVKRLDNDPEERFGEALLSGNVEAGSQLKDFHGGDDGIVDTRGSGISSVAIMSNDNDATKVTQAHESIDPERQRGTPQPQASQCPRQYSRGKPKTYTAFAKRASDTNRTDEFLKSKIQPDTPLFTFAALDDEDRIIAWDGLHLDPEAKVAVQNHEGIEGIRNALVKRNNMIRPSASLFSCNAGDAPRAQVDEPPPQHSRRKPDTYIAYAAEGSDTKKTDAFLKSQIQPNTRLYTLTDDDDENEINAWFNLHLDADAKAAVQSYEGIELIEDDPMKTNLGPSPPSDVKNIDIRKPVQPKAQASKPHRRLEGI